MRNKGKYIAVCLAFVLSAASAVTGCTGGEGSQKGREKVQVSGELEVHFLDVGQGDCTLIKSDGHAMLIDAGENDKGEEVRDYLYSQNIEKLDYVIGTHPDSDHIGGLDVVIDEFPCENILMPDVEKDTRTYEDVIQSVESRQEEIMYPEVGDIYSFGEAKFTVVSPNSSDYSSSNDYSIGILLEHGEKRFLFVGDAEETSEEKMMDENINLEADVYKVSHHGSRTGTTEEFLSEISPEYAVISCGEGNSYGHPHAEVLNELRAEDVEVFRTDEQGTIVATSDGKNIKWNMSPSDEWKAGEPTGSGAGSEKTDKETAAPESHYILNTNTKKFHLPSCNSVETIKKENKEERTVTGEELLREGYSPCGNCLGN